MNRKTWTRRQYLRGAGTALVALPLLDYLAPPKARAEATPPRLLVYYLPNGRRPEWWVPSAGAGTLTFPSQSSSLQPFASRALSITNLDNTAASLSPGAAHAMGTATVLTGTTIPDLKGVKNNISVDQRIVQKLNPTTRFKSLQWSSGEPGPCDVGGASCAYTQSVSWAGPGMPLIPTIDPASAFERLFGSATDGLSGAAGETRSRSIGSVLDAVRSDAVSLQSRLGSADKERLDEYFTSLRELEKSLTNTEISCEAPTLGPGGGLSYPDRVRAFHELIKLAFQCDQTRVLSFMIEFGLSGRSHDFIQAAGTHHGLSHYSTPDQYSRLEKVERWHSEQIAHLLGLLDSTPGKSLLDDTLVLVIPSMGEGANHNHATNCPLLFGGGGLIQATGRQINANIPLANLHHTLLRAYGVDEKFGDNGTTEIAGVLA
ncbi:MAG: DUF1552 domain-containing protein [Myxococcales bacterium]|nr:DUF1552 domain-containing protein [Myxococcales bacterium]